MAVFLGQYCRLYLQHCMGDYMEKELWKPGNMLYPLPVVMVSVREGVGHDNIFTVALTGYF